jgi:hypothetical protein
MNWDNLLSGFVGAIIGGACTVVAVVVQNWVNRSDQRRNDTKVIRGYLQAIRHETDTLWTRYEERLGAALMANPGRAFLMYYPIFQDYFTVYNGNSFLLGRIPDAELRTLIVKTYKVAKGNADSFRFNNLIVEKFENATNIHRQTNNPADEHQANAYLSQLIQYAGILRAQHLEVKEHVARLLAKIDKALADPI